MNPQIASSAETSRPIQDTDIGTAKVPTCTGQLFTSRARCTTATMAKISADIATYELDILSSPSPAKASDRKATMLEITFAFDFSQAGTSDAVRRRLRKITDFALTQGLRVSPVAWPDKADQ